MKKKVVGQIPKQGVNWYSTESTESTDIQVN